MIRIDLLCRFYSLTTINKLTLALWPTTRLFQYTAKFTNIVLEIYHKTFAKANTDLLKIAQRCRDLEIYFQSCRRLVSLGRCIDLAYSATRCFHLSDPVLRTSLTLSRCWTALQLFADHVLLLQQVGLLKSDQQKWGERANKFWLYSTGVNLLRDLYEIVNVIQRSRARSKGNLDSKLFDLKFVSPIHWMRQHPQLSCDVIKNFSDFWIPYSAVNKLHLHPGLVALLGITSTTMGIMQIYDQKYRLTPS